MTTLTKFTSAVLAAAVSLLLAVAGCDDATSTRAATGASADAATQASARTEGPKGFTGVFHTSADGTRSVLNLTERGGKLSGMLDAANITGHVTGDSASGDVKDPATAAKVGTVNLALNGDALVMTLTAIDAWGGPSLQMPAVTYTRGVPPPIDVQLDAQLTGRWRHTWAAGDGAGEGAVDVWLALHVDGALEYGKSKPDGGATPAIETAGDDGFAGRWRTADGTLHVLPARNAQWVAFARYALDGEKLTLTFNDGSRQVYYRR